MSPVELNRKNAPPRYSTQVICPYTSANQVGAMLWLGFILFLVVFPKVKYFYFEKKFPGKSRVSNCGDSCSGRRRSQIKRSFEAEISCTHHWKETYLPFPSICTIPPKVTFLYLLFSSNISTSRIFSCSFPPSISTWKRHFCSCFLSITLKGVFQRETRK